MPLFRWELGLGSDEGRGVSTERLGWTTLHGRLVCKQRTGLVTDREIPLFLLWLDTIIGGSIVGEK